MERTRLYYRALGYPTDYVWAANSDVPFCTPIKPLSESNLALITTSSPAGTTEQHTPTVWSTASNAVPEAMFTDNRAWDKETTHTNDTETFLPLRALAQLVKNRRVGQHRTPLPWGAHGIQSAPDHHE